MDRNDLAILLRRSLDGPYTTPRLSLTTQRLADLRTAFHAELDCLVYADLIELYPRLAARYQGIAFTRDAPTRAIANFVFIGSVDPLTRLTRFISASHWGDDMQLTAAFLNEQPNYIADTLPVVPPSFDSSWRNEIGEWVPPEHRSSYSNHYSTLGCVFDAAALGQYLFGVKGWNLNSRGFINERAVYRFDDTAFVWRDIGGSYWRPYIVVNGEEVPVATLHGYRKYSIAAMVARPYATIEPHAFAPGGQWPAINFD